MNKWYISQKLNNTGKRLKEYKEVFDKLLGQQVFWGSLNNFIDR